MYVNEKQTQNVGKVIDDYRLRIPERIKGIVGVGVALCALMWLKAMIRRFGFR